MTTIQIMQAVLFALELLACITGFLYWKRIRYSFWKWFPFYLAYIVLSECAGYYLNFKENYDLKIAIINYLVIPVEFIFLHWLYLKNASTLKRKRIVVTGMIAYVLSLAVDCIFFQKKGLSFSFSYSIGNLSLLIIVIAFYIQLATSNEVIHFKKKQMFWVSLGLLVFYLGSLPFFGLLGLVFSKYYDTYVSYAYVMLLCNCIMYLLFTISFIWSKPK